MTDIRELRLAIERKLNDMARSQFHPCDCNLSMGYESTNMPAILCQDEFEVWRFLPYKYWREYWWEKTALKEEPKT